MYSDSLYKEIHTKVKLMFHDMVCRCELLDGRRLDTLSSIPKLGLRHGRVPTLACVQRQVETRSLPRLKYHRYFWFHEMPNFTSAVHEIQFRLGIRLRPHWGDYNPPIAQTS